MVKQQAKFALQVYTTGQGGNRPFVGKKPDEKLVKAGPRSAASNGVLPGMLYSPHACKVMHIVSTWAR